MWRYLAVGLLALLPMRAYAAPAPQGCGDNFFQAQMPEATAARMEKARLLCFSEFATLHLGLSKTPLWSAEHLTGQRVADADDLTRRNAFHAESGLPVSERSTLKDYKGSGFDRGHMAPSGDMATDDGQWGSFSLANMIPQDPCSNEEQWEGIESTVRQIAKDQGEVYVVTGPVFPSGAQLQQIGNGVLIPPFIFKAIYIPAGDLAGAYVAPNTPEKTYKKLSIDQLKAMIDVDVFPTLKAQVKSQGLDLPPPQPPRFRCRTGH
jgi:endonuclease G, mitochondrial